MKTKTPSKKRALYNGLMAAAIVVILAAAVLAVGSIQGWFAGPPSAGGPGTAQSAEAAFTAQNKVGGANIERAGIAYSLSEGTQLRDGDTVETLNGSSIELKSGEDWIFVSENSEFTLHMEGDGMALSLSRGEIFAVAGDSLEIRAMDARGRLEAGAASVSSPSGSANFCCFAGEIALADSRIAAGEMASVLADGVHSGQLSLNTLNDFQMESVRRAGEKTKLCFTAAQIDELQAEREEELRAAEEAQRQEEEKAAQIEKEQQENKENPGNAGGGNSTAGDSPAAAKPDSSGGSGAAGTGSAGQTAEKKRKCTIEIRCDTILENMGDLEEGKNKYVPSNGKILARSTLEFEEGETVFDVLKRACSRVGIQLEYSWTPVYNSYYVEGINHLYEFDCGNQSGWMYQVNGWYPNYGCSAYTLKDGDAIVWRYTCKGYGADLGAPMA